MPIFVAALIGGLISAMGTIIGRILISLSIGFVVYQGISALLDAVKGVIVSNLTSLPSTLITIASLTQVDTAISIIFSAYAARFILQGLTSGALTKMVHK